MPPRLKPLLVEGHAALRLDVGQYVPALNEAGKVDATSCRGARAGSASPRERSIDRLVLPTGRAVASQYRCRRYDGRCPEDLLHGWRAHRVHSVSRQSFIGSERRGHRGEADPESRDRDVQVADDHPQDPTRDVLGGIACERARGSGWPGSHAPPLKTPDGGSSLSRSRLAAGSSEARHDPVATSVLGRELKKLKAASTCLAQTSLPLDT